MLSGVTLREVTSAGVAALALVLVASACSGDDDPTAANEQNVFDISTDTPVCMQVTDGLEPEVKELPVISCDQPHSDEIYATIESAEEVYPGVVALSAFAEVRCLSAFEDFVGISVFDSTLTYSWLVPSLESWNTKDDRDILCVLMRTDRAPLQGSMRDAQV